MTDQELLALCTDVSKAHAAYEAVCKLRDEAENALQDARAHEVEAMGKLAGLRRKLEIALGYKA